MKKVDMYWMSNRDWWFFQDGNYHIKDDAPDEAKVSFERYLKQIDEEE